MSCTVTCHLDAHDKPEMTVDIKSGKRQLIRLWAFLKYCMLIYCFNGHMVKPTPPSATGGHWFNGDRFLVMDASVFE